VSQHLGWISKAATVRPPSQTTNPGLVSRPGGYSGAMVGLIVTLLVIWLILAVLGLVLKGLFWLFVIGAILFVLTGVFGFFRRRT